MVNVMTEPKLWFINGF